VRAEEISAARERNRVARELHDSVNQSIFSITLTAEAARTMLDRDPARVPPYLNQLQEMTTNALAQMRSLIGQLRPKNDEPATK
jgi:signal transduction histidine kinase